MISTISAYSKRAYERISEVKEEKFPVLDLRNFFLTKIPGEVFQLDHLEILSLEENYISELPPEIGKLTNLKRLNLERNRLSHLPKEIGRLKKLEYLNLNKNEISQLPLEIGQLENLSRLNLYGNNLSHLPSEIGKLKNLTAFDIDNYDSILSPPPSVIRQGLSSIKEYLRDMSHRTAVWASKIVIVGEGGVGKTSMLNALEGKDFIADSDTTHGIEIRPWKVRHQTKRDIYMKLQVWDFGGQEIYHATHQFYLTNHSLFMLVWSARAGYEAGKIYKWLETIHALAPDSPVLVIATHCKERGADLPKGDILSRYPGKIQFFAVDNRYKQGIDPLGKIIRKTTTSLKYMGIERPRNWVNATQAVRDLDKKCLSRNELFTLFQSSGVDIESHESLAVYLHELGHILYYPEDEDLRDIIIIKPAWVSKHIARILDDPEVTFKGGFLPRALMNKLWHDLDPHWHDKFITLMEKFDLAYRTDVTTYQYQERDAVCLVVEKLKFEEHPFYKDVWDQIKGQPEITFKYVLDTIPAGIPTWFIARTHRFSQNIHWRYGALLKDKSLKHVGLVIAKPERKEVWLHVRGPMPHYFFAQLRDTLEFTFSRFEGLKYTVYIPCPGHGDEPCDHFFDLKKHLEKRLTLQPPKTTIECPIKMEDVDVSQMLFGISFAPHNIPLVSQITRSIEQILDTQTGQLMEKMHTQNRELAKFIQLEFLKSYQIQQDFMDQTCPNIFTLKPQKKPIHKKTIEKDEYELQLYCQMPGWLHPVKNGKYSVEIPKAWLIKIAPYYNKILQLLKRLVPVLIPDANSLSSDFLFEDVRPDMGMMKDYINSLRPISIHKQLIQESLPSPFSTTTGSELRVIRQFLQSVDASKTWGNLTRIVTPERHILWLCPDHIKEYK